MKKIVRWVKLVVSGFSAGNCPLHAAGLTYFSMLALVPLLCVLLVFAKAVGADDFARRSVNEYLDSLIVNIERGQDDELLAKLPMEEADREKKARINKQTVEVADTVVEKQMRIVQEIASLLGETAAETKIALTKLKESIDDE